RCLQDWANAIAGAIDRQRKSAIIARGKTERGSGSRMIQPYLYAMTEADEFYTDRRAGHFARYTGSQVEVSALALIPCGLPMDMQRDIPSNGISVKCAGQFPIANDQSSIQ